MKVVRRIKGHQANRKNRQQESLLAEQLQRKALMDTPTGCGIHRIVQIIGQSFTMPYAMISLHDKTGTWFNTCIGFDDTQLENVAEFVNMAASSNTSTVVTDPEKHECFTPRIGIVSLRFAAIQPLITAEGKQLGYVSLFDEQTHCDFSEEKKNLLGNFASLIIEHLATVTSEASTSDDIVLEAMGNTRIKDMSLEHYHQLTEAVLDSIEDGIIFSNAEGTTTLFNKSSRKSCSVPQQNLPVEQWASYYGMFHVDGKTPLQTPEIPLYKALHGERVQGFEMTVRQEKSAMRHIKVNAKPLYDQQGAKIGAVASMHDITDQLVAQRRYWDMYNRTPALMHSIDPEGNIICVSDFWLQELGYKREEVIGHQLVEFMSDDHRQEAMQVHLPEFFRQGECKNIQHKFVKKDGGMMEVLLSAIAERNDQGDIERSLSVMVDISEKKVWEETALVNINQFNNAFKASAHGMALISIEGKFLEVNPAGCEIIGYSRDELLQLDFNTLTHPEDLEREQNKIQQLLAGDICSYQIEKRYIHKSGKSIWVNRSVVLVHDSHGKPLHFVTEITDLTKQKEQDARELQNQKLDAVGQLSGGLAHDFNNLLAVILGNLELIERSALIDDKLRRRLKAAMNAALSGADLTRRLLSFSRKQMLQPELLNVNEFLSNIYELAHRTLGKNINLQIVTNKSLWLTLVDPNQLEAAVLNLALNSRDAMPNGGQLTITTDNVKINEEYAAENSEVSAGDYVKISVSDNGTGMSEELVAQVFEPYFSTKPAGKGSGLGLSMVLGFIMQSGGHIKVCSEEGEGTRVALYLPRVENIENQQVFTYNEHEETDLVGGDESLIVVDDDQFVRKVLVSQLSQLGYDILQASNGSEALELLQQNPQIRLLLSDIVMPGGINGVELAEQVYQDYPQVKVIHSSGFASDTVVGDKNMPGVRHLLSKPYRKVTLAAKVREVLDENT